MVWAYLMHAKCIVVMRYAICAVAQRFVSILRVLAGHCYVPQKVL